MKKIYNRKLYVCLALIILPMIMIPAKAEIRTTALSPMQVPLKIEAAPQAVFILDSLTNKQLISSGAFEVKAKEKLIIEITSTIKDGGGDLFLFSPSGKQMQYSISDENQTIEVHLTQGRWAYNCTAFWQGEGSIKIVGIMKSSDEIKTVDE